jgi:hypothetical protein
MAGSARWLGWSVGVVSARVTVETVTEDQLWQLREQAIQAGDDALARTAAHAICFRDRRSLQDCVDAINRSIPS